MYQLWWLLLGIQKPNSENPIWLVVSTQLKNISQNGNLPQIGMKIKNLWNHHLENQMVKTLWRCLDQPPWLRNQQKTHTKHRALLVAEARSSTLSPLLRGPPKPGGPFRRHGAIHLPPHLQRRMADSLKAPAFNGGRIRANRCKEKEKSGPRNISDPNGGFKTCCFT